MTSPDTSFAEAARDLVRVGRFFSARGSVPATSGNFSVRLAGGHAAGAAGERVAGERAAGGVSRRVAITRSGVDKGELTEADILMADIDAAPPAAASAETPLHFALYRDFEGCGAVVHTHADAAAILSMACAAEGRLVLAGWELLKALRGVATHEAEVVVPVFGNDQDVPALAGRVSARLSGIGARAAGGGGGVGPGGGVGTVAYLLAGHGLYTWGASLAEAQRHAVALEHLLTCELERRKMRA